MRLSALRRRPRHARLLRDAIAPLRRHARIRAFDLPNGDLVAVGARDAPQIAAVHAALCAMLDDPAEAARLVALHSLPVEAAAVLAAVESALGLSGAVAEEEAPRQAPPLGTAALAAAERALAAADLAPFVRRQVACRLDPAGVGAPEPLWQEHRAALMELAAAVTPGADPLAAPWLLRRLRRVLDRRLLAELSRPEELRDLRRSYLPLSVESVTDAAFLRFDALLPRGLRTEGGLIIGFAAEDVLTDPAAFRFARDVLRARGHRVALDGAGLAAALALPAERAGFDLVRLRWSPGLAALDATADGAPRLRAALPAGPDRVVLADVDRPAAIAWGWEMGITLFQGRLVERRRAGMR